MQNAVLTQCVKVIPASAAVVSSDDISILLFYYQTWGNLAVYNQSGLEFKSKIKCSNDYLIG